MNDMRELNDAELEAVFGGMSCDTAIAISRVYALAGNACGALGDHVNAAGMYGKASGITQGGCDKG